MQAGIPWTCRGGAATSLTGHVGPSHAAHISRPDFKLRQPCGMSMATAIQRHQVGTCLARCRLIMNGNLCLHRLLLQATMHKSSARSNAARTTVMARCRRGMQVLTSGAKASVDSGSSKACRSGPLSVPDCNDASLTAVQHVQHWTVTSAGCISVCYLEAESSCRAVHLTISAARQV